MTTNRVGEHDPMVFSGGLLGVWAECECGWIGPSRYTESTALVTHALHVSSKRSGES